MADQRPGDGVEAAGPEEPSAEVEIEAATITGEAAAHLGILGDFRLLRKLGEGAMGVVFRAHQISMDRDVALKILPEHLAANPEFVDRFYREARMSAKLDHVNVVRGIAVGQVEGQHYFAMEFIDGEGVDRLLARRTHLSVAESVKIAVDVARALDHAHVRGLVHRDVKPANIMITHEGVVKLADLGLAKAVLDDSGLTVAGAIFGTPSYMAPEQARDAKTADSRSDMYALGATLYHCLTGVRPFPGKTPWDVLAKKDTGTFESASRINPEVPPELDAIIATMMARDPAERFQTPAELVAALEETGLGSTVLRLAPAPGSATIAPSPRLVAKSPGRRLAPLLVGVIAVGGLAAVAVWWSQRQQPAPTPTAPAPAPAPVPPAGLTTQAEMQLLEPAFGNTDPSAAKAQAAKLALEHPQAPALTRAARELEGGLLALFQYQSAATQATSPWQALWLATGVALTQADNYRVAIVLARPCHVYVFQVDAQPSVTRLFPNPRYTRWTNPLQAGRWLVPSADGVTEPWLHLDERTGTERIYVVGVTRPLRDVGALGEQLLASPDAARAALNARLAEFLEAGEPAGVSCSTYGALQELTFEHR